MKVIYKKIRFTLTLCEQTNILMPVLFFPPSLRKCPVPAAPALRGNIHPAGRQGTEQYSASEAENRDHAAGIALFQRKDSLSHTPIRFELGTLQTVEAGNIALLKQRLTEPLTGRAGQTAKNPLQQEQYTFAAFMPLV
jgi:hypothetical protein